MMAEGIVFITKRGSAWTLTLKSSHDVSSLDCDTGWKNRRGDVGRATLVGPGTISQETEQVLDTFLQLENLAYVNIVDQNFLEFSFDRPLLPNNTAESEIVKIIKKLLEWDVAYVEDDYSEPQAHIVPHDYSR